MPINYKRHEIDIAIATAWSNKAVLLVYPSDMDLVIVDMPCEEHEYLSHTYLFDATQFDNKNEYTKFIKSIIN